MVQKMDYAPDTGIGGLIVIFFVFGTLTMINHSHVALGDELHISPILGNTRQESVLR